MLPPLEPINNSANPAFKDAASCAKWLGQLQLTNLNLAHSTLRAQIDEFNRFPARGKDRLQAMEALRETVATVQADFAKKLFGKKLPFDDDEFALLIALSSLWQSMLNGYLRCVQVLGAGDSSLAADAALLSHRCVLYSSLQLGEFLRAGCDPDGNSWQRLHTIYAHIEEQGLHLEAVTDKLSRADRPVSCSALYAKILLLHRARLLGLTRSQWIIVDRWLEQWAEALTVEPTCSMSKGDAPPLAVDLAGMRGLVPIHRATSATSMRYLAMVPLSKLIRVKTILLQQGQGPQQNGLGDELSSKDCIELFNKLLACWCEPRPESLADEPREVPSLQMCIGLEKIYSLIAGKPFKQSNVSGIADKEAQKQIETFGRVLDETDRHKLSELGFLTEEWLADQDGLLQGRLLRKTTSGDRLGLNQILSVHKADAADHKIGVTSLVTVTRGGHLYIGVRYLPGAPRAISVRGSSSGNLLSGATAALLLPEMANLRIPASLILPRDWFQTGRPLELTLQDNQKQNVILGLSIDKGNDYERVSFSLKS